MRRVYSLVSNNRQLITELANRGLTLTLNQEYNYIITELCELRPIQKENNIMVDSNTIKNMIKSLKFFRRFGTPCSREITYVNYYIDRRKSIRDRILDNLVVNDLEKEEELSSREYIEEDYIAAKICEEWLTIGLKYNAYLQSIHKPV